MRSDRAWSSCTALEKARHLANSSYNMVRIVEILILEYFSALLKLNLNINSSVTHLAETTPEDVVARPEDVAVVFKVRPIDGVCPKLWKLSIIIQISLNL